jgi:hypothetical protein
VFDTALDAPRHQGVHASGASSALRRDVPTWRESFDKSQAMWTLQAAVTHRGGIVSHVSLACHLLMEELIGLDESVHGNVFRIATRAKTSLVYMSNKHMTLHE